MKWPRITIGLPMAAAALGAVCSLHGAVPAPARSATPPATRPNILMITVDSLRADRLGCYTAGARPTAALDALAATGVRFTRAYTASPSTAPSNASLLTGVDPLRHGLRHDLGGLIDRTVATLAERLAASGYVTSAVTGSFRVASRTGLDRGFARYDDDIPLLRKRLAEVSRERRAADVVDRGLRMIASTDPAKPFFTWLNLYDPHYDYEPPDMEKGTSLNSAYDGEVAYLDAQIGRLIEGLGAARERTVIVVAGSHGEGLGDHQETGHGSYLYETTIRVPLIIVPVGPASARGKVIETPVSLLDVMPTLLDLGGADRPKGLQGESLAPQLKSDVAAAGNAGARPGARRLFVEAAQPRYAYGWSPLYAVIEGDRKIVQGARTEAFDLKADPIEAAPLAGPPRWARELVEAGAPRTGRFDPEGPERQALLDAINAAGLPWDNSPICVEKMVYPDPRDPDRVALNDKLFVARNDGDRSIPGRAAKAGMEVLESDPANYTALSLYTFIGIRNHWGDMVLEPLELLVCGYPFRGEGYHLLGHFYSQKKQPERALAMFRLMRPLEPWDGEADLDMAAIYAGMGQKDTAFDHLRQAMPFQETDEIEQIRRDPRLANIKDDPRFTELLGPPPAPPAKR